MSGQHQGGGAYTDLYREACSKLASAERDKAALRAERDRLKGKLAEARRLLEQCQSGTNAHPYCPGCGTYRAEECRPWCPIASSLAAAPAEQAQGVQESEAVTNLRREVEHWKRAYEHAVAVAEEQQAQGEATDDEARVEESLINRIAEAKSYALAQVAALAKRVDALERRMASLKALNTRASHSPAPPPPEAAGPGPHQWHIWCCAKGRADPIHAVPPIPGGGAR
jgi:hypothetical protein